MTGVIGKVKAISMSDVKRSVQDGESRHWFDRKTMRYFNSRHGDIAYESSHRPGKAYFISSEKFTSAMHPEWDAPRKYSIREVDMKSGRVENRGGIFEFQRFDTKSAAKNALSDYLKHRIAD